MSLYNELLESVIYEDSVEEYKERIDILSEGTKESDLLHDINNW